jgi:hypothetical protein
VRRRKIEKKELREREKREEKAMEGIERKLRYETEARIEEEQQTICPEC